MVENSDRVRRARTVASACVAIGTLCLVPVYGWPLVVLMALSALNTQTLDRRLARSAHPEYHAFTSIIFSQAMTATAALLTGGPHSPVLPLIAVPTAFAATRFRTRIALIAGVWALVALLVVTLGVYPSATLHHPVQLLAAYVIVIGVFAATLALNGAEQHLRTRAILDPLTGLLNRSGLESRFHELAEQARISDAPISMLICDLDHFKVINDSGGHAAGDAALRDVADAMRAEMRTFELIYRIGGEEFLVMLPGASPVAAEELAERLCAAVRSCRDSVPPLTVSIGLSTRWGAAADFDGLFSAADKALYAAKAAGRDRVCGNFLEAVPNPPAGESYASDGAADARARLARAAGR